MRLKVNPADAEDVVATVFMSALASIFSGETPAEFRAWLMTITRRRIADYHRAGGLAAGLDLFDPTAGGDDEGALRTEPAAEGEIERAETELVLVELLQGLGDGHRLVVDLYVIEGHSAAECAERVNGQLGDALDDPMTEANVHQIASRFRTALRAALAGEGAGAAHG